LTRLDLNRAPGEVRSVASKSGLDGNGRTLQSAPRVLSGSKRVRELLGVRGEDEGIASEKSIRNRAFCEKIQTPGHRSAMLCQRLRRQLFKI